MVSALTRCSPTREPCTCSHFTLMLPRYESPSRDGAPGWSRLVSLEHSLNITPPRRLRAFDRAVAANSAAILVQGARKYPPQTVRRQRNPPDVDLCSCSVMVNTYTCWCWRFAGVFVFTYTRREVRDTNTMNEQHNALIQLIGIPFLLTNILITLV